MSHMEVVPNMEGFVRSRYYCINPLQKTFFSMTAAMCQALPSFYSDYNNKSLFSVFNELYEKKT